MDRQVCLHRSNHGNIVGTAGDVRKKTTDRHTALAMLFEFPRAFQPLTIDVGGGVLRLRTRLAVQFGQFRFRVKRIDM